MLKKIISIIIFTMMVFGLFTVVCFANNSISICAIDGQGNQFIDESATLHVHSTYPNVIFSVACYGGGTLSSIELILIDKSSQESQFKYYTPNVDGYETGQINILSYVGYKLKIIVKSSTGLEKQLIYSIVQNTLADPNATLTYRIAKLRIKTVNDTDYTNKNPIVYAQMENISTINENDRWELLKNETQLTHTIIGCFVVGVYSNGVWQQDYDCENEYNSLETLFESSPSTVRDFQTYQNLTYNYQTPIRCSITKKYQETNGNWIMWYSDKKIEGDEWRVWTDKDKDTGDIVLDYSMPDGYTFNSIQIKWAENGTTVQQINEFRTIYDISDNIPNLTYNNPNMYVYYYFDKKPEPLPTPTVGQVVMPKPAELRDEKATVKVTVSANVPTSAYTVSKWVLSYKKSTESTWINQTIATSNVSASYEFPNVNITQETIFDTKAEVTFTNNQTKSVQGSVTATVTRVSGEPSPIISQYVNPNPATLQNGSAKVKVSVYSEVPASSYTVKKWVLSYKKASDTNWITKTLDTSNRSASNEFAEISISSETMFNTKAEVTYTNNKVKTIEGSITGKVQADNQSQPPVPPTDETVILGTTQSNLANVTPNGVISSSTYNVSDGIPSGETLTTNVNSQMYLYNFIPAKYTGSRNYPVNISCTFTLTWQVQMTRTETYRHYEGCVDTDGDGINDSCPNHSYTITYWTSLQDTQTITKDYYVNRTYSYWKINNLEVYVPSDSTVYNDSMYSGNTFMYTSLVANPNITTQKYTSNIVSDALYSPSLILPSLSIDGGTAGRPTIPDQDWNTYAQNQVGQLKVKNDKFTFNGGTILNDVEQYTQTTDPSNIPAASVVLTFNESKSISVEKKNNIYTSSGTIRYKTFLNIDGVNPSWTYPVRYFYVNSVAVHTPVVINASVYDDTEYNQEVNPYPNKVSLIIGRPNKITFKTDGQHRDIRGYGNRDYKNYVLKKEIRFPFGVYVDTKTSDDKNKYVQANTWYSVPISKNELDIFVPEWTDERTYYTVDYRVSAINSDATTIINEEENANLNMNNYVAKKSIQVKTVGRMYNFKVSDITDYPTWEKVFRVDETTSKHNGTYYYSGIKDKDGVVKRDSTSKFLLPILDGSHPTDRNLGSISAGYGFRFEINTVGEFYTDNFDSDFNKIVVKPKFYYVERDGSNKREVNVYYHERINEKKIFFIKIDDVDPNNKLYVLKSELAERWRGISDQEITDLAQLANITEQRIQMRKNPYGNLNKLILTQNFRTFVGPSTNLPTGVDVKKAKKSVQKWYSEYYLPTDLYVTEKGVDIARQGSLYEDSAIWLKKGFLVVNFTVETYKNNTVGLNYNKMWDIEGYPITKKDYYGATFTLQDGDIIFYHLDRNARDDFSAGGIY